MLTEVYTAKYIQERLNINEKAFNTRSKKLWLLYDLDLSLYQKDSMASASNYKFNKYEDELLIVLLKGIDKIPFTVTEAKMIDSEDRIMKKNAQPSNFIKFIETIATSIDEIEDEPLKSYIYSSKIYDETLEYLSARQKLEQSFSNFIQYTGTLSYIESAKRQRELAYRIDEMLFELIEHESEENNDSLENMEDLEDMLSSFHNLEPTFKRFKHHKKQDSSNRYNHSIEEQLLDWFIVNILNEMYEERDYQREQISEMIKSVRKNENNYKTQKIEKLIAFRNTWDVNDTLSMEIQDSHFTNYSKIVDAVESYGENKYMYMDYIEKIKIIKDDNMQLENHEYFQGPFHKFYIQFNSMIQLMTFNRSKFIRDGISPIFLDYFMRDTQRIFDLIKIYGLSESSSYQKNGSTLNDAYEKFLNIKQENQSTDLINENVEKITSWSFADKMVKNLDSFTNK